MRLMGAPDSRRLRAKCHAAAAFGELKCGVDRPTNRLHVVFNTQQEAGDQLAALLFTAV